MTPIAPITYRPAVTADQANRISRVVALCPGCTRGIAALHLEAASGDVEAACASWNRDHSWSVPLAYDRWSRSLEASK